MFGSESALPLSGLRVLDLTSIVMGPYATQLLADMGAEVIMLEPTRAGGNRVMGPGPHRQLSGIALNLLRNKRSVSLDLKHPEAREAVLRIAAGCDVFVTNLRVGPLRRVGLSYEDLRAVNEALVYCAARGFRAGSTRAEDPAYDDIVQSMSGMADLSRRTGGVPQIVPTILADKVCGQFIVNAVLAALVQRGASGRGAQLEISMVDAMRSFMLVEHGAGAIAVDAGEGAGYRRVLNRFRGPQQTSDGWIHVMPYSVAAYAAVFSEGGRQELVEDDRLSEECLISEAEWLYEQLRDVLRSKPTAYWMQFCLTNHIPVGEVATLDDLIDELPVEQHPVAGTYRVIPSSLGPVGSSPVRRHAPILGADTRHVLAEVGYPEAEIDDLRARRVIRIADEAG